MNEQYDDKFRRHTKNVFCFIFGHDWNDEVDDLSEENSFESMTTKRSCKRCKLFIRTHYWRIWEISSNEIWKSEERYKEKRGK